MKVLEITGRQRACGSLCVDGNKNAALPMIAAALLTDEPVVLRNIPDILDVRAMVKIAEQLGVTADWSEKNTVLTLCAKGLNAVTPEAKVCHAVRTSLLFAGPLAVRCGNANIPRPGGDGIGRRRLDPHFYGLRLLGIDGGEKDGAYWFKRIQSTPVEANIFLDEASVTATEHILMTAVLVPGTTIIRNAACEPHVSQLAELLNEMGAKIDGIETNTLRIQGVEKLHGATFEIGADHVNVASYIALAAATRGCVELTGNIAPRDYWMTRRVFERLGAKFLLQPGRIFIDQQEPLCVKNDLDGIMPVFSDGPWPQFPSDMMSCLIAAATQATGSVIFFEKMFESRIYFVDRLIAMGANAVICDPHRAVISGPSNLHGAVLLSPDIRAGMALVIAACCAKGTSTIRNADMIARGYSHLTDSLRQLGIELEECDQ